jgi:hypothetical protein
MLTQRLPFIAPGTWGTGKGPPQASPAARKERFELLAALTADPQVFPQERHGLGDYLASAAAKDVAAAQGLDVDLREQLSANL